MTVQPTILVIDDQPAELGRVEALLGGRYRVITAAAGNEALRVFREQVVHLVLLDIVLGDMDGMSVLRVFRKLDESVPVIMMSAITKINTVVECMKLGAKDYISKPIHDEELLHAVSRALEEAGREMALATLKEQLEGARRFEDFIGTTPAIERVMDQIGKLKGNQTSVLLTGESGTGKEVVAKAIHKATCPEGAPYLAINCGAIPAELFESELFGHEAGAFTGAVGRKIGKVELAQDGTLFLDEIGTLPPAMQVKLLRVLEEREITRVGGHKLIPVGFRLISATNADLEKEIAAGRFREDLYYRIDVIHLELPPLRERADDIALLAQHFLGKHAERGRTRARFSPEALERLRRYAWPGNVRELENVIERAVILCGGDTIGPADLPLGGAPESAAPVPRGAQPPSPPARATTAPRGTSSQPAIGQSFNLHEYLESLEKQYLEEAMAQTGGKKEKAAALLGIHRNTLTRRMAHFKMK